MITRTRNVWILVGEGEGDDAEIQAKIDAAVAKATEGLFNQDAVNSMLAKDREKHQTQTQAALDEAKALRERSNLNQQEKQELDARIEEMQGKLLTAEEKASREKSKLEKLSQETITALTTDRDGWQQKYTDQTIIGSITSEAAVNKAFNPEHVVAILRPITQLVEVVGEDGEKTGELTPKVKFNDLDKDGKPITMDLTVTEAVKRMTELEQHQALFEGTGTGGFGGSGNQRPKGSEITREEAAKGTPAEYRQWKKDNNEE